MTPTVANETPIAIHRRRPLERAAAMTDEAATPMNNDGSKPMWLSGTQRARCKTHAVTMTGGISNRTEMAFFTG